MWSSWLSARPSGLSPRPGNKHVDLDFLAQSVVIPVVFLTGFVQVFSAAYHGLRHYMETRLLIAAEQEYKVVSYARGNITPGTLVRADSSKGNERTGAEYAETGGRVSAGR